MLTEADGTAELGTLVALQRGTTYKSSLLGYPGPVLLGLASIQRDGGFRADSLRTYGGESPSKLVLKPGDLYVSLKDVTQSGDLLGAVSRVPREVSAGRLTQDTVKLVFKNREVTPDYLYWVLRTPQYRSYCRARAIGTTNLSLSREDFLTFAIPNPTPGRVTMVRLLEDIEAKIELDRRTNETLESVARAIFKSWFVDFDPVRAKAEGRWPMGIDAETVALFPASRTFGEIEIPTGWKWGRIGDVASSSASAVDPRTLDADTPYIGLEHMPRRRVVLDEWGQAGQVTSGKARFRTTDVLFGKLRPYFHKVGIPPVQGVCSTDVLAVAPKSEIWLPFVLMHLSSDDLIDHANGCSTGTKMPRVRWSDIARFEIAVPPERVAAAYGRLVNPMLRAATSSVLESKTLAEVRDTLLPKLLSGELRARDAEKIAEAHV